MGPKFRQTVLSLMLSWSLLASSWAHAQSTVLKDADYNFDGTKLEAAENSFYFFRSFVDYFYLLIKGNLGVLSTSNTLTSTAGWCVGDAHPENFGILLQENGKALFSMNDFDDAGPCPVGLDLLRLMVGARLHNSDWGLGKIRKAYVAGLRREALKEPAVISDLMKKGLKKGLGPDPKKLNGTSFVRNGAMGEVSPEVLAQIKNALVSMKVFDAKAKILDVVSTSKVGGGSGGLLRFEVLLSVSEQLLHLEMKEEINPSIYPIATGAIPSIPERIMSAISYNQSQPSKYYAVVKILGKDMMVRPRFDGNVGVSLEKQSDGDNQDIVTYEAYVLGLIHSRSVVNASGWAQKIEDINSKDLENDVNRLVEHFNKKFSSLN